MDENVLNNEIELKEKNRRKERRKRKKFRLLILLLLLFGTGVMLTTSTYAWFTANRTVSISDIDVQILASNGIQISADAQNWKSVLSVDDLNGAKATYTDAKNQIPANLEPVSTGGTITGGFLDMYYGEVKVSETSTNNGSYILTATKEPDPNHGDSGRYITFDIFLKVAAESPIFLTPGSQVVSTDLQNDKGIKNAARVAFINEGNKPAGTAAGVIQGLLGGNKAEIWEPNYDIHSPSGIANALDVYGVTVTADHNAAPVKYDGVNSVIEVSDDVLLGKAKKEEYSTLFENIIPTYKTEFGFNQNVAMSTMTLQPGITKVKVYMWVEGQDVDCEDGASNGQITFKLEITNNEEPTP